MSEARSLICGHYRPKCVLVPPSLKQPGEIHARGFGEDACLILRMIIQSPGVWKYSQLSLLGGGQCNAALLQSFFLEDNACSREGPLKGGDLVAPTAGGDPY